MAKLWQSCGEVMMNFELHYYAIKIYKELNLWKIYKKYIDRAKSMRTNPEITDYDIAQFVHIELGKVMYYDNNYSAKLENGKGETELSSTRKAIC